MGKAGKNAHHTVLEVHDYMPKVPFSLPVTVEQVWSSTASYKPQSLPSRTYTDHMKAILWQHLLYVSLKWMSHTTASLVNFLLMETQKNPGIQPISWGHLTHTHTYGTPHSSPALRIVYTSGKQQWHSYCNTESKTSPTSSPPKPSQWYLPKQHQKKWHFLERVCRHLWVSLGLDNSETVSRFLCQLIIFGPGKGRFCKVEANKDRSILIFEWY